MVVEELERNMPERRPIFPLIDLNDDLLVEVLVRLPCKDVIRYKSVCKHWMSLISHPQFIQNFLDHHRLSGSSTLSSPSSSQSSPKMKQKQPWCFIGLPPICHWSGRQSLIFLYGSKSYDENNDWSLFKPDLSFLLRFAQPKVGLCVVGSFKDLLLCKMLNPYQQCVYYICHPLTMQFVALPPHLLVDNYECIGFICEPFYTSKEDNILDHHPPKFNYRCRVVRITQISRPCCFPLPFGLEIFSSETGLWSTHALVISDAPPKIRWSSSQTKLLAFQDGQMMLFLGICIVKFDPFKNQNAAIPGYLLNLPREFCRNPFVSAKSVITSQERFLLFKSLTTSRPNGPPPNMKIWELNDDDNSQSKWRLIHQVQLSEIGATACTFSTIVDNPKENPYSKKCRETWVGNFLKNAVASASIRFQDAIEFWSIHYMICVGFDPTLPGVIYLLLCPPGRDSLAAFASYNMQTRVIELVSESMVPHHLKGLKSMDPTNFHHVFPLVLEPWPTPLPELARVPYP